MGGAKRNRPDGAGAGMPSHGLGYSSCGERRGWPLGLPICHETKKNPAAGSGACRVS